MGNLDGDGALRPQSSHLRAVRDPEPALVGKVAHGACLLCDFTAHRVERVVPAGGCQVLEDFTAVRKVHERAAGIIFEVAIAKFHQSRILVAANPAQRLETPECAFRR